MARNFRLICDEQRQALESINAITENFASSTDARKMYFTRITMRFIFMSNKRLFTPDSGDTARSVVMFSLNNQAFVYKEHLQRKVFCSGNVFC